MTQFFVNRGGGRAPEGPFEEARIVRLILAGKISSGHVCAAGTQRFVPLASHPPFAAALVQAGVAPALAPLAARPGAGGRKSSPMRVLGALLAVFGLAIAAVAIGAYIMFKSGGGMLVQGAVPHDTELFVEVTSVPQLLSDLRAVRALDANQVLGEKLLDDTSAELSQSFGVPKAFASALILSASSLGVAGRKLTSVPEAGVLLSFSSAGPVDTFLRSKRFTYDGLVAKNGQKYKLSADASKPGTALGAPGRALSALTLDSPTTILVWFERSKLLFLGSPGFAEGVARVLTLDMPSIEQNPEFRDAQRDFSAKPDAIGYFDAAKLSRIEATDPRVRSVLGYLKETGPVTASCHLVPSGLLTRFTARDSASTLAKRASFAPPLPLTVVDRLPIETFAYAAVVTKTQLSGSELQQLMLAQLAASDPQTAARVSAGMAQIEARLHLRFDQLLGSIGDQVAVAALAPPDYNLALAPPRQMLGDFAVVYLQALKDDTPWRALAKQLEAELSPLANQFAIQEDATGYALTPKDDALGVSGAKAELRFANGYLLFAVGNAALVERSRRALLGGENTLALEPAQRAARAALPSQAQLLIWVDAGRILESVEKNPLLAARAGELGLGALRFTGPDRVTAALALSTELQNGRTTYRIDTLNIAIFSGIFGLDLP
jgi:hypothetical protein